MLGNKPVLGNFSPCDADSVFVSVKAVVTLKTHLGLYFHGLVKTAHKKFPKEYLQEVTMTHRGEHKVVTATVLGVSL